MYEELADEPCQTLGAQQWTGGTIAVQIIVYLEGIRLFET